MSDTDRKTVVTEDSAGQPRNVEILGKRVGVEKQPTKIVGGRQAGTTKIITPRDNDEA